MYVLDLPSITASSQKSFGTSTNGILAPPKPLKTDPSQHLYVSSLESVDESPPPELDETPPVISTPSELSKEHAVISEPTPTPPPPPPPPPPVMPPPLQKLDVPPPPPFQKPDIPPPPFQKPDVPPPPSFKKPDVPPPPFQKSDAPPLGPRPPPPGPPPAPKSGGPRPPPPGIGPPPPLKGGAPRPPPGKANMIRGKGPPPAPRKLGEADYDSDAPKTKLKPFFWDKVQAKPNQSMVWDRLKAGSFQ